ncbi:MotA/TolQ/ExbB proton channel family protein [Moraxella sp. ZY210820]|uniref:MotA/TolQ/ExbB proton channel family protein n=1 Tax=unclassified Moraxella TaxID=2685852 RepID=UPI0027300537|nr:MotA/TolQ/ExbB proton channel family protein [Moraxella sp. ZY210820]WLF84876.1 MotA/TolQ/ExbB proton channel family protein [Moraxella sp. ZY210820]
MWELVKAGGWLMIPLLLCSLFTLAISIERFLRLKKQLVLPQELLLKGGQDVAPVIQRLSEQSALQQTALGGVFIAGYKAKEHDNGLGQNTQAQMEVAASKEILKLEKNINFLGTLSAVAPLLGLLGTVLGIIESFLIVDMAKNNDPAAMIPGISKALITTAVGMIIAVPALFAYRYFQRLVNEYIAEIEQQATLFHAALFYQKNK